MFSFNQVDLFPCVATDVKKIKIINTSERPKMKKAHHVQKNMIIPQAKKKQRSFNMQLDF